MMSPSLVLMTTIRKHGNHCKLFTYSIKNLAINIHTLIHCLALRVIQYVHGVLLY